MKKTFSKKTRVLRNILLLILLILAVDYFSGLPAPIPEIQFRREERAHLVGPGQILGIEEIDFSWYDTMIVARTEQGVILWTSGQDLDRSALVYREQKKENLLLAAPGSMSYLTIADTVELPLVLFDRCPRAARAEILFTLKDTVNGEPFEKTYHLSSERTASGYFLFTLNAGKGQPYSLEEEALILRAFAEIASGQNTRHDYSVPVQIRFYDLNNTSIGEETILISGDPQN